MDTQDIEKRYLKNWKSKEGKVLVKDIKKAFPNTSLDEVHDVVYKIFGLYKSVSDVMNNAQRNDTWVYKTKNGVRRKIQLVKLSIHDGVNVSDNLRNE